MSRHKHYLSIWFFIGSLLLIYGVLIGASELYALSNPPAQKVVLYELHAGLWWGALLTVLGALYVIKFRPGKD